MKPQLWLVALLLCPFIHSQEPPAAPRPDATLVFHFLRPGLPVPEYTLTVHEDGSGSYAAAYAAAPDKASRYAPASAVAATPAPIEVTRPITLTQPTTAKLFERIRGTDRFHSPCESREKNIANTGAKTLTYTDAQGSATCTYNYTENKLIAAATETFQGIAETLDEGRTIELTHRFDRLGLDKELAFLSEAVQSGRAIEVLTIAPVLQSLCNDQQVMERVRKRAASLLQSTAEAH